MYREIEVFPSTSETFTEDGEHFDPVGLHLSDQSSERLPTIVLQPSGCLTHESSEHFQQTLEDALGLADRGVIVDLLWLEEIDATGIAAFVAGIERAACLAKTISFQSMSYSTRLAMEAEWERQRQIRLGDQRDRVHSCLKQFLEQGRRESKA